MGLDMYLTAERYLWQNGDNKDDEIGLAIAKMFEDEMPSEPYSHDFRTYEVSEIRTQAAYWRKCNQIHRWFVENVQNGEDQCKAHGVNREQLQALLGVCETVMNDKDRAGELLPPQEGFFFGSTDLDEWYWDGVQSTIDQIRRVLDYGDQWQFEYRSSW